MNKTNKIMWIVVAGVGLSLAQAHADWDRWHHWHEGPHWHHCAPAVTVRAVTVIDTDVKAFMVRPEMSAKAKEALTAVLTIKDPLEREYGYLKAAGVKNPETDDAAVVRFLGATPDQRKVNAQGIAKQYDLSNEFAAEMNNRITEDALGEENI